jgi:hypothetical protein
VKQKRIGKKGKGKQSQDCIIDPLSSKLLSQLHTAREEYLSTLRAPKKRFGATSDTVYLAYHLLLTPTGYRCEGPLPDQSNSLLRRYSNHDCFLKVSFRDEEEGTIRREYDVDTNDLISTRFRPFLTGGLLFCGRRYEFLGYSMSSLKEWSFMFITPFKVNNELMTASRIREQMVS